MPQTPRRGSAFQEYLVPAAGEPLRQGDILESVAEDDSKWKRLLLVLTADCDFAHGKNHGRVTCVPILTSSDYLLEFHMKAVAANYSKLPLSRFEAKVRSARGAEVPRPRLLAWVREASLSSILDSLNLQSENEVELEDSIRSLALLNDTYDTLEKAIEANAKALTLIGQIRDHDDALVRVRADLRTRFNSLPGDAIFLGSIGPGNSDGYCAYLRHIEQIWESDVSVAPNTPSVTHRRLARLTDKFVDAVAQQFGMVFMSIGLPPEYEEAKREHANRLAKVES